MDWRRRCHLVTSSRKEPAALLLCMTPSDTWWLSSSSKIGVVFVSSDSVPESWQTTLDILF